MKKIIHHLRKQSEADRRHMLHIFIFCAAVIMLLVWVYSLGSNLANPDTQTKIGQNLQPFSILKDSIPLSW